MFMFSYIIDANNLAGKLKVLGEEQWQQELIRLTGRYFTRTKKQVFLVFDGGDRWGDKYRYDSIVVIHAPKDDHCSCADDRIVELMDDILYRGGGEVVVVTDDIGIREEVKKRQQRKEAPAKNESASTMAVLLREHELSSEDSGVDNKGGLENDDMEEINRELRQYWNLP